MTNAISELRSNIRHWCTWDWVWDAESQKYKKPPMSHDGKPLSVDKPEEWSSYDRIKDLERKGFLLTVDDPYTVVDQDDCIVDGEVQPYADHILYELGSYSGISPSGTGLHSIFYGVKPENSKSKFYIDGHKIEVYDRNQYITFTDDMYGFFFNFSSGQHCIDKNVPVDEPKPKVVEELTEVEELGFSDQQILDRLSTSKSGEAFSNLWKGNISAYDNDDSRADLALCAHLTKFTKDEDTIDRIFRSSGLYRKKWDRPDYKKRTINKALVLDFSLHNPAPNKDVVEELLNLRSKVMWRNHTQSKIYGSLLAIGYNIPSKRNNEGLILDAALLDIKIVSGVNHSHARISGYIHDLEAMGLIKILEKGSDGKATTYLTYSPETIKSNLSNLLTSISYSPLTSPLCKYVLGHYGSKLRYQKGLNPAQEWALELILQGKFSIGELASIVGMRKNHSNSRALKDLGTYVRVDKKGFVNRRKNIDKVIDENYDEDRFNKLTREVKLHRERYMQNFLFSPFERLLEESSMAAKLIRPRDKV